MINYAFKSNQNSNLTLFGFFQFAQVIVQVLKKDNL
uniref:Uncharacterized protein n=1 Tax=Candidatus Berkiella cookevillensis TaxID=437022 RepID=A0A0Q9YK59_9GAMM